MAHHHGTPYPHDDHHHHHYNHHYQSPIEPHEHSDVSPLPPYSEQHHLAGRIRPRPATAAPVVGLRRQNGTNTHTPTSEEHRYPAADQHRSSPPPHMSPTSLSRVVPLTATQASSRGLFCRNGELFAIAHTLPQSVQRPHSAQGVGAQSAAALFSRSTYRSQFSNVNPDPNAKKMQPYRPGALRNRLPVRFVHGKSTSLGTTVGKRNPLTVSDVAHSEQFVSINQRFYRKHSRPPVGFMNPGIVAQRATWSHKRIND